MVNYCQNCNRLIDASQKYCSNGCWADRYSYSRELVLSRIYELSLKLGRSPSKREYKQYSTAIKLFGTWNNALLAAGLAPNRSADKKMYNRRRCVAKDGHKCDSISELIIDNWLDLHSISHQKDACYPSGNFRADWSLPDGTLIEYFGLATDSTRYDLAIKHKKQICMESKVKLIEIYPCDLYPNVKLDSKFTVELDFSLRLE